METSLHRALKDQYGSGSGGRSEVTLTGFRIDAVDGAGLLVEIQSGPLGPLRAKLGRLLPEHRVRVVKPVVLERRVVTRARTDGPNLSARRSPKRGAVVDLFEDLVGLARILPDPNLDIEVLPVSIDEIRVSRRRRPGYRIVDRRLVEVLGKLSIERPAAKPRLGRAIYHGRRRPPDRSSALASPARGVLPSPLGSGPSRWQTWESSPLCKRPHG